MMVSMGSPPRTKTWQKEGLTSRKIVSKEEKYVKQVSSKITRNKITSTNNLIGCLNIVM